IFLFTACGAVAQKVEDDPAAQLVKATPSSLPQLPVAARAGSDAKDDGLKGRVKTLLEEKEYLDKTEYPAERRKSGEQEFGNDGNLIKHTFFDYRGNPSFIVVYGYLGGKRVSKAGEWIRHSYDPPPMMALPGTYKPEPKGDDRYTNAWEYKYDKSGRIVEELRYNNAGEANYRTLYEYGDKIEKRLSCNFPCSGQSYRNMTTFDADGRAIKLESDNPQTIMDPDSSTTYRYLEFDAAGNWTKREATGTRAISRDGTKPIHYIEYRTFTYY
ncbi:MAG: hypothetical protein ABL952_11750, partial [Pyrinomonadaceae bacterium]